MHITPRRRSAKEGSTSPGRPNLRLPGAVVFRYEGAGGAGDLVPVPRRNIPGTRVRSDGGEEEGDHQGERRGGLEDGRHQEVHAEEGRGDEEGGGLEVGRQG